jgi:single-stranded-DNA-specific exonuclease
MKVTVRQSFLEEENIQSDTIISAILRSRNILDFNEFLSPKSPINYTLLDFGFDNDSVKRLVELILSAFESNKKIVVYTDYDADGITGGAILWETLHLLGFNTVPYVPNRKTEGYGFSEIGLKKVKELHDPGLIISVDHGIAAIKQIQYAKSLGMPVVVTDHHHKQDRVPEDAELIFHIPTLSGSATAYFVAKELFDQVLKIKNFKLVLDQKKLAVLEDHFKNDYVALSCIGTVADLVSLTGRSRGVVFHGLKSISTSSRPGIKKLIQASNIAEKSITTYDIGFLIAPRINAVGRIDDALDALRLLCTTSLQRAQDLALKVSDLNTKRQEMVLESVEKAVKKIDSQNTVPKVIILEDKLWHEGIIGLIAAKILEKYYRPVIIMTSSEGIYKASVRSIPGFHITNFLGEFKDLLLGYGGHEAAAGFSILQENLDIFKNRLSDIAKVRIPDSLLERNILVDVELDTNSLSLSLFEELKKLEPWGIGNTRPLFLSKVKLSEPFYMGKEKKHVKFKIQKGNNKNTQNLEAVFFNGSSQIEGLDFSNSVYVIYNLDKNEWNGKVRMQAIIKYILPLAVNIKRGII